MGPSIEGKKAEEVAKRFNDELFALLEQVAPGSTSMLL
jgi:hypothetical protein